MSERLCSEGVAPEAAQTRHDATPGPQAGDAQRTRVSGPIIQTKLSVGAAGDSYEREADAVAAKVVRALQSAGPVVAGGGAGESGRVQRAAGTQSAAGLAVASVIPVQRVQRIQRAAHIGAAGGDVDSDTERMIQSAGSGSPMPDKARSSMESAFGADFGAVRVHAGPRASELNERIQAKAFTTGNNIFFRDGLPDASSSSGQELLAHELTHTIQQGGGKIQRSAHLIQRNGPLFPAVAGASSAAAGADSGPRSRPRRAEGASAFPAARGAFPAARGARSDPSSSAPAGRPGSAPLPPLVNARQEGGARFSSAPAGKPGSAPLPPLVNARQEGGARDDPFSSAPALRRPWTAPGNRAETQAAMDWFGLSYDEMFAGLHDEGKGDDAINKAINTLEKLDKTIDYLEGVEPAKPPANLVDRADAIARCAKKISKLKADLEKLSRQPIGRGVARKLSRLFDWAGADTIGSKIDSYTKKRRDTLKALAQAEKLKAAIASESIDTVMAVVDTWLVAEAKKSGHETLIQKGGYGTLAIDQKVDVFRATGVDVDVDNPASFKELAAGWIWSGVDWPAFAANVRKISGRGAAQLAVQDGVGGATTSLDVAGYVNTGAGVVAGLVVTGTTQAESATIATTANQGAAAMGVPGVGTWKQPDRVGALETMSAAQLTAAATGIIGSLITLSHAGDDIETMTRAQLALDRGAQIFAELGNITAQTGGAIANIAALESGTAMGRIGYDQAALANVAANSLAATGIVLFGAATAVGGAFKMMQAGKKWSDARQELSDLAELKKTITADMFVHAMNRAETTQELKRTLAKGAMAQGAAMLAGGVLVAAMMTNPIGWTVLVVAGALGGMAAAYSLVAGKKSKAAFAKTVLNKVSKSATPLTEDELNEELMTNGFAKGEFERFHDEFVGALAHGMHAAAFAPAASSGKTDARQILSSMFGVIDDDEKTPTVEQIMKHLVSP
jgi:hypothetical protein